MAEAFPLSGNIDPKTFPYLLADLHRQGATGSLKVEGPSYPKALYFRSGRVLFGSSNDPKDQLGAILIESGKISAEQLDEVNTKVGPGNPLAKVLAESGFVNQRELSEAARVKVERILSDVVSYSAGTFEFEDGVLPKGAVDLKLSTEKLVLAAVSRLTDRSFVLRHLDSLGVVLAPAPDMGERMGELRPEAGDLPERLDGKRSLKDAASLTRLDEFDAAKVACALLFLGLVEKTEAEAGSKGGEEEVDLAQTARMAFDGPPAVAAEPTAEPSPPPAPEPAFFVPEAEVEVPAFDVTVPDTPAPRFGEVETPPLGVSMSPPAEAKGPPPPEPGPLDVGFSLGPREPAFPPTPAPATAFNLPEPDEPTVARIAVPSPPPTGAFDRPNFSPASPAPAPPTLAFEEEPPREPLPPAPPSKEDLAALDALLNPSASMRTASAPAQRPRAENWEPQFRPGGASPAGSRPNRRRSAVPLVPVAAGVLVLLAAGATAWFYFGSSPKAPVKPVARLTPAPPPSLTIIEASPAPSAPPDTTPAVTTPPAPPSSTLAASPPTQAAVPPTTAPSAPPRPKSPSSLADARLLLERHDYPSAARGFATSLRSSPEARFSVQLLVACSEETVGKAMANAAAPELFILPVSYKGKSCYRLCWGIFETEARAERAVGDVPAYFRDGGARPKVSPTASLLP